MTGARNRRENRRNAKLTLAELFSRAQNVNVIHYSCESFYDRPDGNSPRITSIAVRNLQNGQTISFSIHQIAERNKVSVGDIEQEYDHLERKMLAEFYKFVEQRDVYEWLHWNMRNINYGFQAIAHRYSVLGGIPIQIADIKQHDLSRILFAIYGPGYADHPRLTKIIEMNQMSKLDFISGEEEARAFENKEYVKLHQSTLRKVDLLAGIAETAYAGKLKTKATWRDMYGSDIAAWTEMITEHWLFKLISVIGIGTILALIGFIISLSQ